MQEKIYKIDAGTKFGTWNDNISKLMYYDSTKEILDIAKPTGIVADYGGGNGLLKKFIPSSISIDIDSTKEPDIVDNIISHKGSYDYIFMRYILHYLNDYEVFTLFENIKSFHKGKILIQQFVNEDLKNKYFNSINEFKYFRTKNQLLALLPKGRIIYKKKYQVTEQFYKNRLNNGNAKSHSEIIIAYLIDYGKE